MHLGSTLRRRCARDHGAVLNCRRRRGYMRSDIYRSERAALRRLDPDRVGHLRASQRSCREAGSPAVDGLTVPEGIAIRHRHGIHVASMYEIEIASAAVENAPIADERVVDVDPLDELVAAAEPRKERFAKAQRKPANSKSETAAKKTYKRRPINGGAKNRARAPTPSAADERPTAVVERSKAPRRIVNPGPAPRPNPVPIAIAVRSPSGVNRSGIPNVAVFRLVTPGAVVVEVVITDHVARYVARGGRVVFFAVALSGPAVEAVGTGSFLNDVVDAVRAGEFPALTGMHFIGLAAGGNFPLAANHGHTRRVAVFIYVKAKCPSLLHGESQVRGVNFVKVALAQFTDAEVDAAFRKAHLRDALVKI
ncbi:MAG: hypothetical protein DMG51_02360 [Acidobacteria bacterium]|nr:MAG: hypothetical protein DMG51_02360 [Acidobacteriota bacterium]